MKLFEWIGGCLAVLCLAEVAHNPKGALEDIGRGPMPNLAVFNEQLHRPLPCRKGQPCQKRANIGKVRPI